MVTLIKPHKPHNQTSIFIKGIVNKNEKKNYSLRMLNMFLWQGQATMLVSVKHIWELKQKIHDMYWYGLNVWKFPNLV